jgi:hypothetical protein
MFSVFLNKTPGLHARFSHRAFMEEFLKAPICATLQRHIGLNDRVPQDVLLMPMIIE